MTYPPSLIVPTSRPYISRQPMVFMQNNHNTEMPAYGVGMVTGVTSHGGEQAWTFTIPDGTSNTVYIVNGPIPIPAGKVGAGHVGPIVQVLYDTGGGSPSGEYGPTNGSWKIGSTGEGFWIIGVRDLAAGDVVEAVQHKVGSGTDPAKDMFVVDLDQDIVGDGTESNVSFSGAAVLGPKGAAGTFPVDQVTNTRLNLIGLDGAKAVVAYDQGNSTVNANDTWFILGVDHFTWQPRCLAQGHGSSQSVSSGASGATLAIGSVRAGNMICTVDAANNQLDWSRAGTYHATCDVSLRADSGGTASWSILDQVGLYSDAYASDAGTFMPIVDLHGTSSDYAVVHLSLSETFYSSGAGNISWAIDARAVGNVFAVDIEIEYVTASLTLVRPSW